MRRFSFGWFVFWIGVSVSGSVQAGQLPGVGPNPSWTDNQKFEWYLGYMSDATALCGDYGLSTDLAEIASLSPYGRIGMSSISGDRFAGGVCGGIRREAKELLEKKEVYLRYLNATYDCSDPSNCEDLSNHDPLALKHDCAAQVKDALAALDIASSDLKKVSVRSKIPGPSNGAEPAHQARVQFKSCKGSFYIDLGERCTVKQTYTRGDCDLADLKAR